MNLKKKYLLLCPLLAVLWFFPLIGSVTSADVYLYQSAAACLLFLAAVLLCRLLPNRHAALVSALAVGVASCAVWSAAVFDNLPVLLLCGWLRCYREREKGNSVTVYFEVITDLIYAWLVAVVIRLIRSGYSFVGGGSTASDPFPELCLMALVFLLFVILFIVEKRNKAIPPERVKGKRNKADRKEKRIVGVIPVVISLRTFWGLSTLLLAACLLQYTNSALVFESNLYFRTGFRLLFFPWMALLFFVLEALFRDSGAWNRFFRR